MVIFLLVLLCFMVADVVSTLKKIEPKPDTVTFAIPKVDKEYCETVLKKVDDAIVRLEPIVKYYKSMDNNREDEQNGTKH